MSENLFEEFEQAPEQLEEQAIDSIQDATEDVKEDVKEATAAKEVAELTATLPKRKNKKAKKLAVEAGPVATNKVRKVIRQTPSKVIVILEDGSRQTFPKKKFKRSSMTIE